MLFSSIPFLYYFLPCVLILYHIVPEKWKNGALLLASLVFYAWGEPVYVFLMLGMILLNYIAGVLLEKSEQQERKRLLFGGILVLDAAVLGFFKFSSAAWPIGISFYTFQLISYVMDVYRGSCAAQKNPVNLAAYVTMFPQLIAGPIVRYADIEKQLKDRKRDYEKIYEGMFRFLAGLGKKILIANALGELCGIVKASEEKSVLFLWVYAVSFLLQIYFDFSGYSDMAIGLGKIFGFDFLENFNYPYIAKSITEFWRRWHMSLGSWFRDYVYIPLGGNRVSRGRWYFNIFVVWSLTGLWHGADWQFVVWGLLFAVLLIVEKHWLLKKLEKAQLWNHLYVLLVILTGFVIFDASSMKEALAYLGGMFGFSGLPLISAEALYYLKSYGVLLFAAAVGATPLVRNAVCSCRTLAWGRKMISVLTPLVMAGIFITCTAYLIDSSFNPFLYFRF